MNRDIHVFSHISGIALHCIALHCIAWSGLVWAGRSYQGLHGKAWHGMTWQVIISCQNELGLTIHIELKLLGTILVNITSNIFPLPRYGQLVRALFGKWSYVGSGYIMSECVGIDNSHRIEAVRYYSGRHYFQHMSTAKIWPLGQGPIW